MICINSCCEGKVIMNEQQIVTVKQANNKERSFVSMINGERIEIPYSVKDFWFLLENRKGG